MSSDDPVAYGCSKTVPGIVTDGTTAGETLGELSRNKMHLDKKILEGLHHDAVEQTTLRMSGRGSCESYFYPLAVNPSLAKIEVLGSSPSSALCPIEEVGSGLTRYFRFVYGIGVCWTEARDTSGGAL